MKNNRLAFQCVSLIFGTFLQSYRFLHSFKAIPGTMSGSRLFLLSALLCLLLNDSLG